MHFRQRLPNGIRSSGQLKDNYLDGKSGKACHGGKYYLFASPKEGVYHTVLLLPLSFLNLHANSFHSGHCSCWLEVL